MSVGRKFNEGDAGGGGGSNKSITKTHKFNKANIKIYFKHLTMLKREIKKKKKMIAKKKETESLDKHFG